MHYENLRNEILQPARPGGQRMGWALFVRRGMAAWMEAWRENVLCEHAVPPPCCGRPLLGGPEQQNEMIAIWTGMVLGQMTERVA